MVLVGGMLADRADRRWVITVFQSIQMLCPVILVVLLLTGTVEPWLIINPIPDHWYYRCAFDAVVSDRSVVRHA